MSKYNWKVGDKVKIKRRATNGDYRWTFFSNVYSYRINVPDEVALTKDDGKVVKMQRTGAIIPRHLLVRI